MYKGDKNSFGKNELAVMEARKSRSYIRDPDPILDHLQQGDQLSGRILYQSYCATCHERNGKGDNNRFPPLVDSEWVTGDKDRLIDIVLNGLEGEIEVNGRTYNELMPQNSHLEDLAIASILTYVRRRFGGIEGEAISIEQVRKVREATLAKN